MDLLMLTACNETAVVTGSSLGVAVLTHLELRFTTRSDPDDGAALSSCQHIDSDQSTSDVEPLHFATRYQRWGNSARLPPNALDLRLQWLQ
jgi:hypothetical protein